MELIREIYENNIDKRKNSDGDMSYKIRKASRAIVFNADNKIAFLNVSKDGYHKLPGGGMEKDEDIVTALNRELMEEVGVEAKILGEVGTIIEYRDQFNLLQISYCYFGKVVGDYKETSFTEEEKNNGFILDWVDIDEAIKVLEQDNPSKYLGKFIKERDITFLRYAKEKL